ncbi:MAG: hypothetical protein ACYTFW_02465 [Planctomycetota bacterium]
MNCYGAAIALPRSGLRGELRYPRQGLAPLASMPQTCLQGARPTPHSSHALHKLRRPRHQGSPFAGTFDGDNHTISHLAITGGGDLGLTPGGLMKIRTIRDYGGN